MDLGCQLLVALAHAHDEGFVHRDVMRYNARPLYYTPHRTRSSVALAAFTDWDAMVSESGKLAGEVAAGATAARSEHLCQSPPDNLPERACFFEDVNESGGALCLDPGRAYSDLTRVRHGPSAWAAGTTSSRRCPGVGGTCRCSSTSTAAARSSGSRQVATPRTWWRWGGTTWPLPPSTGGGGLAPSRCWGNGPEPPATSPGRS